MQEGRQKRPGKKPEEWNKHFSHSVFLTPQERFKKHTYVEGSTNLHSPIKTYCKILYLSFSLYEHTGLLFPKCCETFTILLFPLSKACWEETEKWGGLLKWSARPFIRICYQFSQKGTWLSLSFMLYLKENGTQERHTFQYSNQSLLARVSTPVQHMKTGNQSVGSNNREKIKDITFGNTEKYS